MLSEVTVSLDTLRSKLLPDQQAELALTLGLCLECGGSLRRSLDGEVCCSKCGLVWDSQNTAEYIPFPEREQLEKGDFEQHWQPVNALGFMKSLGDPCLENSGKGGKALMRVLAKSVNGSTDLGLRAKHIRVMVQAEDPPQLRRVLSRISDLLKRLGYGENWELANYAGNLARAAVAFKLTAKLEVNMSLADAVVLFCLKKFGLLGKQPLDIFETPRKEDLAAIALMDRFKFAKPRRQKQQADCSVEKAGNFCTV